MIDYYEPKLDLTLSGCGFLGCYHIGAIYLLNQIWPQKPYNRICGASSGGLLAALLLVGNKLDHVLVNAMDILRQLRSFLKNPTLFTSARMSVADLVEQKLEKLLPDNAHELCSNRLGVSVTKLSTLENLFISQFQTRRDLINAVCAGCFIPIWSGSLVPPKYRGEHFVDGAYSDNSPRFNATSDKSDNALTGGDGGGEPSSSSEACQIQVSPFSGDIDVSPQGERYILKSRVLGNVYLFNWNNLVRTAYAMLPLSLSRYRVYLAAGHHDMKDYLLRKNLIECRECWNNSGNVINQACVACLQLMERVDSLVIPEKMFKAFEE